MPAVQTEEAVRQDKLLRNVLLIFGISGAAAQPLGSLIPFLRSSYGLSYELSGLLLSANSLGNLLGILLSGFLPALLGRRRTILTTGIWMAVAYLIFTLGLGSPALLLCACLMVGFSRGGRGNFSNTMVSTLPGDKAARGFNLLHGAFATGALLSPLLLVAFSAWRPQGGWRIMTGFVFLLCLCQIAVYLRMELPAEPRDKGRKALDLSFLKIPQFWMGAMMLFFYVSSEYAITGWLVTYFQDIGVLSASQSQIMNSLLWLVIFLGRMIGAAITGRISKSTILVADGIGFFSFFLLLLVSRTPGLVILGLMGSGFFMATIFPTSFAFGSQYTKGNDLCSSVMTLTGSVGGILTPALVGFVAEGTGSIQSGMSLVAIFVGLLLSCILVSILLDRWLKKSG